MSFDGGLALEPSCYLRGEEPVVHLGLEEPDVLVLDGRLLHRQQCRFEPRAARRIRRDPQVHRHPGGVDRELGCICGLARHRTGQAGHHELFPAGRPILRCQSLDEGLDRRPGVRVRDAREQVVVVPTHPDEQAEVRELRDVTGGAQERVVVLARGLVLTLHGRGRSPQRLRLDGRSADDEQSTDNGWKGARQLVRVERVVADDNGPVSVGNRYFVCSMSSDELTASDTLNLARGHWRCENEGHWTADAIWDEDARRTPWTQHPNGILVVGILRAIAINILAVLRALSRVERGENLVKPTWQTCIEQVLLVLFEPLLDMTEFNAFEP